MNWIRDHNRRVIVCFVGYFAFLLILLLVVLVVELNHTQELHRLNDLVAGQRRLLQLKASTIHDITRAFLSLCAAVHCHLGGG